VILSVAPVLLPIFLLKNKTKLEKEEFKEKYESSYDCLKTDLKIAIVYNALFMLRRLLFCLTALFLIDFPTF